MQFTGMDVLEVIRVTERDDNATANGIKRRVKWATLKLESCEMSMQVADGVEVPEGWSGKALCDARVVNFVQQFKNSTPSTQFAFKPTIIRKFTPISKVEKEDEYNSFFTPGPQAPKASADGLKGNQPPK